MQKTAYLILENGMVFQGKSFGYAGEATGELVFTTGMTGYLETITDPSYYGQIVMQTFPLIGNYGVIPADFEGKAPALAAYIVRRPCAHPSNFRADGVLEDFLRAHKIVGLCDIDTRHLTKIVREYGVMNAKISFTDTPCPSLRDFRVKDAVQSVTCKEITTETPAQPKCHIVLWNFGAKANITRQLVKRGAKVTNVPASATAEEILALKPDGIMLSNGPGDPAENVGVIAELKKLMTSGVPMFGICLGHQLLALASGAKTEKLKYGHRGANQPVRDMQTGRVCITSQNHGYTVVASSLPETAEVSFENGNDHTCEGIRYKNLPIFSVQFHPEAASGPLEAGYLFDRFIDRVEEGMKCR